MKQKLDSWVIIAAAVLLIVVTMYKDPNASQNTTTSITTTTPLTITPTTTPVTTILATTPFTTTPTTAVLTTTPTTTPFTTTPKITSPTYTPTNTPITPNAVVIAASNSDSSWKLRATAICTGTNDQNTINTYLKAGTKVELASGTFNIGGNIMPPNNSHLYGQGPATLLNFNNGSIYVNNVSNVELDAFNISGTINPTYDAAIFIIAVYTNQSGFFIHDISCSAKGSNAFYAFVAGNYSISNLTYYNVDANAPDGMGFMLSGMGANPTIQNVTYYHCTVENAGIKNTRINDWVTGFDFCEYSGLTVNGLYVINCFANGAWESDFHFEFAPVKENAILTGCDAKNAGKKTPSPLYGYGFVSESGDVIFYNNTASNNIGGDINIDTVVSTPIVNGISPANSTKTAVAINQNNCSGVIVDVDANHKELVLYSNNQSAVDQQIELGNYYTADDANPYIFNGTKITVHFKDYAIIRLVKAR